MAIKSNTKGTKQYKRKTTRLVKKVRKATKKALLGNKGAIRRQKRAQNRVNKRLGSKKKHTKKSIVKSNKANTSWSAATKRAKTNKATGGASMSSLVKARKGHKKGTAAWKKIQNQINANYGSSKRH